MRLAALAAAALGGLAVAPSAFAAFTFGTVRSPITTGTFAGLDRIDLIVSSDTPTYTLAAMALDVTSAAANGLRFRVPAIGNPDEKSPSLGESIAGSQTPGLKGTFGGLPDGTILATPESNATNKPAYQQGLTTINYVSFYTTPLDIAKTDAPGIVLGSAVVPAGTSVTFAGNLDNDLESTNGSTTFTQVNTGTVVPEPTSLAFLGLAGAGLLGRRSRKA